MVDVNSVANTEIIKDPQLLLEYYYKLIHNDDIYEKIKELGIGKNEEFKYLQRLKQHKDMISRMLQSLQEEIDLFSNYIGLCEEKIVLGADVDGEYTKRKAIFETLLEDDKTMLLRMEIGEKEYTAAIRKIQKIYNKLYDSEE